MRSTNLDGAWDFYTEDDWDPNDEDRASRLLPSSMRDVITEAPPLRPVHFPPSTDPTDNFHVENKFRPRSLPASHFTEEVTPPQTKTHADEDSPFPATSTINYFKINFHSKRTQICAADASMNLTPNTYVISEADRGFDMGMIIGPAYKPESREQKLVHKIIRKASNHEVSMLPEKRQREIKATDLCRKTVREQRVSMDIIDSELQFDGTQLTFYYSAKHYIDFRSLVRVLFRTFGTRIWMVWYDGESPVKDVFSQNDRKKKEKDQKQQIE